MMSNIYFMCENCGIETNGITFVNGMKFCAKCYHQIFGKDNQQTEITQLKQQLVEKDKEIESLTNRTNRYENMFRSRICRTGDMQKDIELYVKQLAIQELEKVKDNLYELYNEPNNNGKGNFWNSIDVIDIIDQQIKELKGD